MDKKVLYSAVVLDDESSSKLINKFYDIIPIDWKTYSHHMTINLGELPIQLKYNIDDIVELRVNSFGFNDKVMAVGVEGYYSKNKIPHITVAVNINDGGKPVMSNNIINWKPIIEFNITGIVKEITN